MPEPKLGSFNYTVKRGDMLWKIAHDFNTTISILRKFNDIPDPDRINVGQIIVIPYSPPEAIIYTVKQGDSLYSIARAYGTYIKNLIDFNYLDYPNVIYPGDQLVVTASLR